MYFLLKMGIFYRISKILKMRYLSRDFFSKTPGAIEAPSSASSAPMVAPWRTGFRSKIRTSHDTVDGRNLAPVEVGR